MKNLVWFLFLAPFLSNGQSENNKVLTYAEYIGFVKKYHPLVKSANLQISTAQANLMMARGGFDPKIEVDFDKKEFKDTEYYSVLNSSFKIPTWYGIEIKAGFDNNEGVYLNPQNTVPNQGLTSLGIAIPVAQGLLINQRMADVRKAKAQIKLSRAERDLACIEVIYNASIAYFNWKRNFTEVVLYEQYLKNAKKRYSGISKLIEQGDKPAIDSTEAGIILRNRMLNLEDSRLKLAKSKLDLSNFLWLENNIPLELQDDMIPEDSLINSLKETLQLNNLAFEAANVENHPKINALNSKIEMLNVEQKLKANMLLPKIDVAYAYLTEPSYLDRYTTRDYKVGVNFYFPLFLRKERGSLQMTKYKLQDTKFDLDLEKLQIQNKIKAQQTEIESLEKQRSLIGRLVRDSEALLLSEERLFGFGESSIFLINSRENSLVSSQLSQIAIENRYLESNALLFRMLGKL